MPRRTNTRKATRAARRRRWERNQRREHLERPARDLPLAVRLPSARIDQVLAPRPGDG